MRATLSFILLIVSTVAFGQSYTVKTVPNVKLINNSYVSNPDNILSAGTVAQIDSALHSLESAATAQVAVVVLASIGEYDVFLFAQELFDDWKIGQAGKDNGLLILLVKDQRIVRFHTGYGIEGILPDASCKRIQREFMVPYFKEGDYDKGMLEGVLAIANVLSHPDEDYAASGSQTDSDVDLSALDLGIFIACIWLVIAIITFIVKLVRGSFWKDATVVKASYGAFGWLFMFIILPVIVMVGMGLTESFSAFFAGLYGYFSLMMLGKRGKIESEANRWIDKKDYQAAYNLYKEEQGVFSVMRFLLPLPFAFMYDGYKKKLDFARNHPRECKQCGQPLNKLDEKRDDAFLSKEQLLEETLKSVDYDVWKCSSCNAAEKLSYINEKSEYSACPKCATRAYYQVSNRVIKSATTLSEGKGEERHACKQCGHQNVRQYTIARKQESSSSSGSSSSSSGGSWGGGSSGGGGASSSW